jgi:serine-type D-Ala-D-Ala carboxypeptidase/endopeptidase (penicillin-binding protein 4)
MMMRWAAPRTHRARLGVLVACVSTAACSLSAPPIVTPPVPVVTAASTLHAPTRPVSQLPGLRQSIDSLLDDPRFRNAFWGVLIVDPVRGDTLYARNAHKLFVPASNMKVITSSVALTQLGADFTFRTVIAARGRIRHGTLEGDLVVVGRGDPTMSDHMRQDARLPLRAIAESLATRGVHRITGGLVSGGDAFPDANLGMGWEWDDLTQAYAAGVDELFFNEGFTTITVRGGRRAGAPVRVTTAPIAEYPSVRSHVTTVAAGGGSQTTEPRASVDPVTGDVVVDGAIALSDTTTLLVAYPDPAAAYLHALVEALRQRGIALHQSPAARSADPSADVASAIRGRTSVALDTLFTIMSPPLRDVLPALLKPSQNQIAEILLKTLGLERTGVGSSDSGRRVVEAQLAAWGVPPDEAVIRDGSGLSRHDFLTPATLVRVLTMIQHDTAYRVFYDALPIAGVDGTIGTRMRGTPAAGQVHAKTGLVDRARSLSGYVTTADGVGLIFSFLCNNWTVSVHEVEEVQDEIAVRLASLTVGAR